MLESVDLLPQDFLPDRLDLLFQYTLAIASVSEDFRTRELGQIHLLKYAYLADLAHARSHEGQTFTGTDWGFHHFGPWSPAAFERIEPSLAIIAATSKKITSKFGDDFIRYSLGDADGAALLARLEEPLPFAVSNAIGHAVHEHGSDTESLLRNVYLTEPMVNARPGESLDFSVAVRPKREPAEGRTEYRTPTVRGKKERQVRLAEARAKIADRLASGARSQVVPTPAPRFDDVFLEGTAQLDASAGEALQPSEGTIEFDDSIWKSEQRRGTDIP